MLSTYTLVNLYVRYSRGFVPPDFRSVTSASGMCSPFAQRRKNAVLERSDIFMMLNDEMFTWLAPAPVPLATVVGFDAPKLKLRMSISSACPALRDSPGIPSILRKASNDIGRAPL